MQTIDITKTQVEVVHDIHDTRSDDLTIGIFIHIYYLEIAYEIVHLLQGIKQKKNIYISTNTEEKKEAIEKIFNKYEIPYVAVKVFKNVGFDIAPFLIGFSEEIRLQDICLKIHTKQSPDMEDGGCWRNMLFESLMGSTGTVDIILANFLRNPQLGIVCPSYWKDCSGDCTRSSTWLSLLEEMDVEVSPTSKSEFPSGSMFWFRSKALEPLLKSGLDWTSFETEKPCRKDETLAYAIERLFLYSCAAAGYTWARLPQAKPDLDFTGERFLPDQRGDIELEHRHRYLLASEFCRNKDVLDIACGEGYGSDILSRVAKHVTGVDVSLQAIEHAQKKYFGPNIRFIQGDAAKIPVADSSIDIVVSFETIEHHAHHEEMLKEIKRILRPGGILYMSSPDKVEYSEIPNYTNPYHVKELTREDFTKLVGQHFKHCSISGQRLFYGSAIGCEDTPSKCLSWDLLSDQVAPCHGVPHAMYLIALASDRKLPQNFSGILASELKYSNIFRTQTKRIIDTEKILDEKKICIENLQNEKNELDLFVKNKQEEIIKLNQYKFDLKKENDLLRKYTSEIDSKKNAFHAQIEALQDKNDALHVQIEELHDKDNMLRTLAQSLKVERDSLQTVETRKIADMALLQKRIEALSKELQSVYASRSWRLAEPLRKAKSQCRALAKRFEGPLATVLSVLCMGPVCWRMRALAPRGHVFGKTFMQLLQDERLGTILRLEGTRYTKELFLLSMLLQKTHRIVPSWRQVREAANSQALRQSLDEEFFTVHQIPLDELRPSQRKRFSLRNTPVKAVCIHVAAEGNHFFREIAKLIACGFEDLGLTASIIAASTLSDSDTAQARKADLHLVVAPHEYFHFLPEARLWPHVATPLWILNTEQAHTPWFKLAASTFDLADMLLDMDSDLSQKLAQQGWTSEHLPLGYSARCTQFDGYQSVDTNPATMGIPRHIRSLVIKEKNGALLPLQQRPLDCCFFGNSVPRRTEFFAKNAALFARMHAYLRLVAMNKPLRAGINTPLTTESTSAIIRRSKISLNIHQSDYTYFEWHRMVLQGFWQGALVVSEPCTSALPFQPNKDYISVCLKDMPAMLEYLLYSREGQEQAEKIRTSGYTTLTRHCQMAARLKQLLQSACLL